MQLLQGLSGLSFEEKGLTFAVHYRNAPEVAQAEAATLSAAGEVVAMLPLRMQRGRRMVELLPLLDVDKGTAAFELLEERAPNAALYVGDDYTDAAAMRGLERWSDGSGKWAAGVAVASEEMPEVLVQAASYRLEGLAEVRGFLQWLQAHGAGYARTATSLSSLGTARLVEERGNAVRWRGLLAALQPTWQPGHGWAAGAR